MDGTQAARAVCSATGAWFCGFKLARCHATQSRRTPGAAAACRFNLTIQILVFFGGLVAMVVGADLLVRGATRLALSFGISPLVVGLTIVALGTSAPEFAVSVGAAMEGCTDIAIGNVIGSNTFNILAAWV